MPSNNIERSVSLTIHPVLSLIPHLNIPLLILILVRGRRIHEVSFVCEAVGADGAEVGDDEVAFEGFADPAAGHGSFFVDGEFDATGDHDNLFRLNSQFSHLRRDQQHTLLRYNKHIRISRIHRISVRSHILSKLESADSHAVFHVWRACPHHCLYALVELYWVVLTFHRTPP